jgi:autotransporter-associated beta strand protein
VLSSSLLAAPFTWNGGGANNNFSTGGNWTGGAPGNSTTTTLTFAGTTRLTPNDDQSNFTYGSITFSNTAGLFVIGGNAFTLNGVSAAITNNSANTETINNNITLGQAQTWTSTSGPLAFGGVINTGTFLLSLTGANNQTLSNSIGGTGGLTVNTSGGTTLLSGNNSYSGNTTLTAGTLSISGTNTTSGNTTLTAGTLNINSSTALGSGPLFINGGTIDATVNFGSLPVNNAQTWGGNFAFTGTNILTFGGTVALGTAVLTVTVNNSGVLTETGVISSGVGGGISKAGTGTLVLSGNNSFTGGVAVTAGTLTLSGASSTYTGGTTLTTGTLNLNSTTALGAASSALTINSGTIDYPSGGAITMANANAQTWAGNFAFGGSNSLTMTGTVGLGAAVRTVTVNNSGVLTESGVISGAGGGISKAGTGTLVLSGNNSFTGGVAVTAGTLTLSGASSTYTGGTALTTGTLNINSTTALGGAGSAFTINSGTIDNTSGSAITMANANAQTWAGNFAFTGTSNLTMGGTVALGAAVRTVTVNAGVLTETGVMSGAGGGISKAGAGTLVLSGNNSFTGGVAVTAGTLTLSGAANTYTGGTTLTSGTLNINSTTALGAAGSAFAINGGTIDNTSGGAITMANANAQTWGGNFTFTGTNNLTLIGTVGLGAADRTVTVSANTLTENGIISGNAGVGIVKAGGGTLVFGGNNTYTGNTTVNAGTLTVNSGALLAGSTSGIVMGGGTLNLNNTTQSVASLTGTSGTVNLGAGTTLTLNDSGTTSYSGALGGANPTATFSKSGTGTYTLSGNSNTYTGAVKVTQGTLIAGSANALGVGTGTNTISNGAALGLSGSVTVGNATTSPTYSVSGTGVSNSGAIYNVSGTNTLLGNVTLTGATTIGSTAGSLTIGATSPAFTINGHTDATENGFITLGNSTVGNGLTFTGTGTIVVNDRIRDYAGQEDRTSYTNATTRAYGPQTVATPGNVTINMNSGADLVHYVANANSYTGATIVQTGTLLLDTTSTGSTAPHDGTTDTFHAINGALQIGSVNTGAATTTATVQFGNPASELMAIGTTVNIFGEGKLDLNSQTQTIDALTFSGAGLVTIGSGGHLYLNNDVTVNATSGTAVIDSSGGYLALELHRSSPNDDGLGVATRTFTVTNTGVGLTINAIVQAGNLVKAGNGTLTLTNSLSSYLGTTSVNAGILSLTAGSSGSTSPLGTGNGTDAQGTTVASGASLQLSGNITISTEKLNLNGNGFGTNTGALRSVSGNNSFGLAGQGYVNLVTDSRINTDAGLLTIPTNITSSSNNAITFGGAGNTTVSGGINTGTGGTTTLTKDGNGTLTLSGTNGYQGLTSINNGTLVAASNGALGSILAGTVVASGAELQLVGGITIGQEALTLNGTGYTGAPGNSTATGALHNVSGSNTFQGVVTLTGAANNQIYAEPGTSLILSGGMTSASNSLVVDGAGSITESGTVINGTGALTKNGSGTTSFTGSATAMGNVTVNAGTLAFGGTSASVSQVHLLNSGSAITVASGTTLATKEFDSDASTTLTIASGGTVNAVYTTGSTTFSGQLAGAGTFSATGTGTLVFNRSETLASGLALIIGGTSIGKSTLDGVAYQPFTLSLTGNINATFASLRITGDTILDFGLSSANVLSSTNLTIDSLVKVTVNNWISMSDAWYATSTFNGVSPATLNQYGVAPENQITFTGFSNYNTSWITQGQYPSFNEHEIRPVPEPSTYGAILVSGCFGWIAYRRFRRRSSAT